MDDQVHRVQEVRVVNGDQLVRLDLQVNQALEDHQGQLVNQVKQVPQETQAFKARQDHQDKEDSEDHLDHLGLQEQLEKLVNGENRDREAQLDHQEKLVN